MPTYSTEDIAWSALYIAVFAVLLLIVLASLGFCMWQPAPTRHSRVIKHIILTPGENA